MPRRLVHLEDFKVSLAPSLDAGIGVRGPRQVDARLAEQRFRVDAAAAQGAGEQAGDAAQGGYFCRFVSHLSILVCADKSLAPNDKPKRTGPA